ncbi:MAG: nucleotide sugar dehydrogenase [Patescibacteria group bacterium]
MKKTKKTKKSVGKRKTIAIVGIGYVGLPLACLCANKGYKVFGIGKDRDKIAMVNAGISPIKDRPLQIDVKKQLIEATDDYRVIKKAGIVIICVPTPVDDLYTPDLGPVRSASEGVQKNLTKGQLVIVESTINPGVCEEVVLPILERQGKKVGRNFYLAHCPERINPGDKKWKVHNIPRVVGAFTSRGLAMAVKFYESILNAPVRPMKTIKEAEATKIVENSFRDINIAFVNELARSFDRLGIDVHEVIQGAATKPFAYMPHYPSIGVGGHCIPVDPYYLIEKAKLLGFDHEFLKLARVINNRMPYYGVKALQRNLNTIKKSVKGTKVGVLGLSYKADVGDMRETPTKKVIEYLKVLEAEVHLYDPHFLELSTERSLDELLEKVEAIILCTNHKEFVEMDLNKLKKNKIKVIIDGKNCWDKEAITKLGIIYKGIGR